MTPVLSQKEMKHQIKYIDLSKSMGDKYSINEVSNLNACAFH